MVPPLYGLTTIRPESSARGNLVPLNRYRACSNAALCLPEDPVRAWHPTHLFLLAALCSSATSCRRDTRSEDEAAIRAATREWNAAEAAKDLEKCISFYAEDGERFATGSPAIRGAAALRRRMAKGSLLPRNVPVEHVKSGSFQLRRPGPPVPTGQWGKD